MAALARSDSRQYSWWWDSHISPKNSKWLQDNLTDMDVKVKAMIKLINEDADSFARRAEMYYKKRPELMKFVEEFYRAYRALAERYDHATGALRQAHRTMSEAFPNQIPSFSEESPSSSGREVEPHTPEMPTPLRAPFDPDDLQKDALGVSPQLYTIKRNCTLPEETAALSSRKGLKQLNDLFSGGEGAPRVSFEGKVRKGLNFENEEAKGLEPKSYKSRGLQSPEVSMKEDVSHEIVNLQKEVSRLLAESQDLKHQISSEAERANKSENEIQSLKDTVSHLNSEKDATLLQYQQSTERLSSLESELNRAQTELKTLTDDIAREVEKLNSAETRNLTIQSELEMLDQKVKTQEQELEQKKQEMESLHISLQEERGKHTQAETALLCMEKQYAQSQEEAKRLALEIDEANGKLTELKQTKVDLESAICELKKKVEALNEQNVSSKLLIKELCDEINSLKETKDKLESEIRSLKNTISQLSSEKDIALLQHKQSLERVSDLESQLFRVRLEVEKIEQKGRRLEQDLEQKREEADNLQIGLQNESQKRAQAETALLAMENQHSQSQEEVKRLVLEIEKSNEKLNKVENSKTALENMSRKLTSTISDLNSEKDAALLQHKQSLERVSDLDSELSRVHSELEKIEQKVQMLVQELEQKDEKVESLNISLQDEGQKRMQAETALLSMKNLHSQSKEEVNRLVLEIEKLNGKLNEVENTKVDLENMSCELRSTISDLNSEKDAVLLQHNQSLDRVSDLESQLSKAQLELEKIEQKVQMLEQECQQKREEADGLQISLQNEGQKRTQAEAALLAMESLHSESQEEVNKLVLEIENLSKMLNEAENSKFDLEYMISNLRKEVGMLSEQNLSAELTIKDLCDEMDALKEMKEKLENEVGLHLGEKEVLRRDFARQKEEREDLEKKHRSLTDEMEAARNSAATLQQLLEELQITNFELKEACARYDIEKALLSEKVQDMERLSDKYAVLENSLSDASAEMEALREKITALEASESSLKDDISSHISEKGAFVSQLEILGQTVDKISERNSLLENSLSEVNAELGELRTKLKDSEESCQSLRGHNSALLDEKSSLFDQLENITILLKALEGKHADLEDKHSSLSIEKDLVHTQARELQDQLGIRNQEREAVVQSHQMQIINFEKQISSLQEKNQLLDHKLEEEQQKNLSAFVSILILESSLSDIRGKNLTLFDECQKYLEAFHHAEMLISQLEEEARHQEGERKALSEHNEKLREGISWLMKELNIHKDLGPASTVRDEILLQNISQEISKVLKLKEESEDVNQYIDVELSVLATILTQLGLELRDLNSQKWALDQEVEMGTSKLRALQNKNHELWELNEQLRQELQVSGQRENTLATEILGLSEKLSCLKEAYQTSQGEICNLNKKNEAMSREYQILMEKHNVLVDENGVILEEHMMLDHLSLFFRSHNTETAVQLKLLTDEMDSLNLVKNKLDDEVKLLSRKAGVLEVENKHLQESVVYLDDLKTCLLLLEFDLNTSKIVCEDLAIDIEGGMTQLMQKDDELLEADKKVQSLQKKNKELCGVLGALQVAIEGAEVVREDLEKKITTLTEGSALRDDEILTLREASKTLLGEVDRLLKEVDNLKEKKDNLTSELEFVKNNVEQHEGEMVALASDMIISVVNAAVYEEKVLELIMEGEGLETSAITQREMLIKEISSRDAYIDELHKMIAGMKGENAELKADLSVYLPLIASLSDRISALEVNTLSLSKLNKSEDKQEAVLVPCVYEDTGDLDDCHSQASSGALELQKLIAKVEALQEAVSNAKNIREQEFTESAAKLDAANIQIQDLRAQGDSCKEGNESRVNDEKQKDDANSSKAKQGQIMKDIELDQISTCSPYGNGTGLYPLGGDGNSELDDEMLQLWETAERDCKNQTAKSSSSEHDIQAVEEVKSEYPSSELARGRDLASDKLEMSKGSLEPQLLWSKKVLERVTSDAQRLSTIQASIEELKRKMEGSSKGKPPMSSEYNSIKAQLDETEGVVLEQIDINNGLTKKAESCAALLDNEAAEQEDYSNRRRISEQAQKASEKIGRLELELQKIQYVLLKLEEEHEYRRIRVSDKRTRVLLRDYIYGRKDNRRQKKKKKVPFCGCMRPKTKNDP